MPLPWPSLLAIFLCSSGLLISSAPYDGYNKTSIDPAEATSSLVQDAQSNRSNVDIMGSHTTKTTNPNHGHLEARVTFAISPIFRSVKNETRKKRWGWQVAGCVASAGVYAWDDYRKGDFGWGSAPGMLYNCATGALTGYGLTKLLGKIRSKRDICINRKKREANNCYMLALAFQKSDQNEDKLLEFSELHLARNTNETIAKEVFDSKDTNGNGYLEPDEVHPCLNNAVLWSSSKRVKRCSSYSTTYTFEYYPVQSYSVVIV